MRRPSFRHFLRLPIAIAVALGLLAQLLLPPAPAFANPLDTLLALGSICHAGPTDTDHGTPKAPAHDHAQCCVLCQAAPVLFVPPDIPAGPIAPSVLGLTHIALTPAPLAGATHLAYASRAPPRIG